MQREKLALVTGILGISVFPILVKMGYTSGLVSAFYRMFFAFIILLPIVLFTKAFRWSSLKFIFLALLCGALFGADVAVWNIAIEESTATQATLLTNLSPIWVGIGAFLFLADKPRTNFWVGTVVALLGMVTIVGFKFILNLEFDRAFLFGILSGVFYSIYFLVSKRVLDHMKITSFMLINLAASSVFLGILNLIAQENLINHSAQAWFVLLTQAVVCQLIAWLALNYAVSKMRATRVSLALLGQAVLTAFLAWLLLNEPISFQMLVGSLILLSGIAITFIPFDKSSRILSRKIRVKNIKPKSPKMG
ncbi:DMT family transporter [Mesonia sp. HuA40]|uniref:DMT family transporter n=1 Tax=Mesonia sp. HuA40 TaxID=2602761 RepID=UPI0011CBB04E|nr:DMT family transporter [Mesonia sp. HuA40]TXK70595.1 DMT family transporter [Mesonia sp. HuA40]